MEPATKPADVPARHARNMSAKLNRRINFPVTDLELRQEYGTRTRQYRASIRCVLLPRLQHTLDLYSSFKRRQLTIVMVEHTSQA
jgi:hypothetical protein